MYYYPVNPPYLLLLVGFLTALTSGIALTGTLKVIVQKWPSDRTENTKPRSPLKQLIVPFLGITGGICLFLYSGFEIFGFPTLLALGVGLPVGLLTCLLLWVQLGSMLEFVERRGMQSLDLDSLS
jgi:membrane protein CcdC involved in cytochrome C biogenesis